MHPRGETDGVTGATVPGGRGRWRRGGARRAGIAGIAIALLAGCSGRTDVSTKPPMHPIPDVTLQDLREAPEDLKFGGVTLTLEVDLWRDFQPPSPPEGRPLAARAVVTAENAGAFPGEVTSAYVWVVMGGVSWASWMENQGAPAGKPNARTYRAGGGPTWGPSIEVDVVIGFRAGGGSLHLVRIPDVTIVRTD